MFHISYLEMYMSDVSEWFNDEHKSHDIAE